MDTLSSTCTQAFPRYSTPKSLLLAKTSRATCHDTQTLQVRSGNHELNLGLVTLIQEVRGSHLLRSCRSTILNTMKIVHITLSIVALSSSFVDAFPRFNEKAGKSLTEHAKRAAACPYLSNNKPEKRQSTFDPSTQYVSTSGANAFVAPNLAGGDQRGPCPGLNALANHGYLPHNGVAPATTIINAVESGKTIPSFGHILCRMYQLSPPSLTFDSIWHGCRPWYISC